MSTPRAERPRPPINLMLHREVVAQLDAMIDRGEARSRGEAIEIAVCAQAGVPVPARPNDVAKAAKKARMRA